jgi:exodeoxyribonuclease V alpha subunit
MNETITAVIKSVRFSKDTYYILHTKAGTFKGELIDCGDDYRKLPGLKYCFTGKWESDKYGPYFKFEHAEMEDSLFFFLTNVMKYVGEKLARLLIETFGDDLERIMDEEPQQLLNVKGIGEKKQAQILTSWQKQSHLRVLTKFIDQYHISASLVTKIYNYFGDKAIDIIKESPYQLANVPGIGFQKADEIAIKMGVDPESPERQQACADYIISNKADVEGHSYISFSECVEFVNNLLDLEADKDALKAFFNRTYKYTFDNVDGQNVVGFSYYKESERNIYKYLERNRDILTGYLSDNEIASHAYKMEAELNIELSRNQKWAVYHACKRKLFTLTGYAGTGKSSVAKIIMSILNTVYPEQIVGCAFSGIAARRLSNVSGFPAYTIHSLLEYQGGMGFQRNETNRLDQKVIVLDEAGMVNISLFNSLIKALPEDAVFIMIGDDAQLPAIGAGNVFSDIINNKLTETVKLDKVFRQNDESVINVFAQDIRRGIVPSKYQNSYQDWNFLDCSPKNYWELTKTTEKPALREIIVDSLLKQITEYVQKQLTTTEDILTDFQVLSPMRKGLLGTVELNRLCQNLYLNPEAVHESNRLEKSNCCFCVGDKVVHTSNKNMPFVGAKYDENNELETIRVYNGTLGIIKEVDNENDKVYVAMNTGHTIIYDAVEMGDIIELAYALTVHKAQGSEFKTVMVVLSLSHYNMLDNQWFYTAVTRAKEKLDIIGEDYAFKRAAKNVSKKIRNTWLNVSERLIEKVA